MAEFNVIVASGECKRICLDTRQEPISGVQSGIVMNSSDERVGRITSASCLLLEIPDTYTVVTSDGCGVLGVTEEIVPCPPSPDAGSVTVQGPIDVQAACGSLNVNLCELADILTGLSDIVTAIQNQQDYEFVNTGWICDSTTGTWQQTVTPYINGVAGTPQVTDSGISCDQPAPDDFEINRVCDPTTNTVHLRTVSISSAGAITVIDDLDTGEVCNQSEIKFIGKVCYELPGTTPITFDTDPGAVVDNSVPANGEVLNYTPTQNISLTEIVVRIFNPNPFPAPISVDFGGGVVVSDTLPAFTGGFGTNDVVFTLPSQIALTAGTTYSWAVSSSAGVIIQTTTSGSPITVASNGANTLSSVTGLTGSGAGEAFGCLTDGVIGYRDVITGDVVDPATIINCQTDVTHTELQLTNLVDDVAGDGTVLVSYVDACLLNITADGTVTSTNLGSFTDACLDTIYTPTNPTQPGSAITQPVENSGRVVLTGSGVWSPNPLTQSYTITVIAGTPSFTDSFGNTSSMFAGEAPTYDFKYDNIDTTPTVTAGAGDTVVITYIELA